MIKDRKEKFTEPLIEIDLHSPEGNAFVLIAYARRLADVLGMDKEKITKEMTENDYEHLINTFEKYFSEYVILYR